MLSARRLTAALIGAAALSLPASARAEDLPAPPKPHQDPVAAHGGPLDLRTVAFGQQATRLELRVVTAHPWSPKQLTPDGEDALCLVLSFGEEAHARERLCVAHKDGGTRPILVRTDLDATGAPTGAPRPVVADVAMVDERTLLASIAPFDIDLPFGSFSWRVETRFTDAADDGDCAAGCADRLPATGDVATAANLLTVPRCFGAAARDAEHPCSNPALRSTIVPTPDDALLTPNAACRALPKIGELLPCTFGVGPGPGRPTIALLGDSHAVHWRGALEVVAQAEHWQGVSLTKSSCPFTRAGVRLDPPSKNENCRTFQPEARDYLRRHEEISAIFVSAHGGVEYTSDPIAGFRTLWSSIPAHVKHIYVLRDTPAIAQPTNCLDALVGTTVTIGYRCSQPRSADLRPDPEADAARAGADPRVEVIDLTRLMCTPNVCPPVIGGVLVHKDGDHLTRLWSTTMGPLVLRALRRL